MKSPEKLRAGLQRMIDLEREAFQSDPTQEARGWAHKVSEVERKRSGFQDMAAEGLITFEELRAKLENLEKTRKTAERELEALKNRSERIGQLERDRDALLSEYAGVIPQRLENFNPEDRHRLYKTLELALLADASGNLEATGVFVVGLGVSEKESTSSLAYTMSRSWC
jgi:chromosome segregation ATPase